MAISESDFELKIGPLTLLTHTKLVVAENTRYGLIGRNGSGKSTLLKYLANKYATGSTSTECRIYYQNQEIELETRSASSSILDAVLEANHELTLLLEKEKQLMDDEGEYNEAKWEELQEQLSLINPGKEKATVHRLLFGLGFPQEQHSMPLSSFSGGWKKRVSLAKALYLNPQILLLDEPTNHLDLNAVIWLTEYLSKRTSGSTVVVSHDIAFLNKISQSMIVINNKSLDYFKGNYHKYQKILAKNKKKHAKEWKALQKKVTKMRKSGKSKKEVDSFLKKKGLTRPPLEYDPKINISNVQPPKNNNGLSIAKIEADVISYGTVVKPILQNIKLEIKMDSRITIVGKNGSGKSTLLRALALSDDESKEQDLVLIGHRILSGLVRVGYFHQHFTEMFNYKQTPIEYLMKKYNLKQQAVRQKLGTIGIPGKQHKLQIKELSGGQKARLAMVDIILKQPHLIILDEPTNHLDIETIDSLVEAINNFNGAVLTVTHNAELIKGTESQIYICSDAGITKFDGYYDDYAQMILDEIEELGASL